MVLTDWKKSEKGNYWNNKKKRKSISVSYYYYNGTTRYAVDKMKYDGSSMPARARGRSIKSGFKNEQQALAYTKAYMKKH